MAVETKGTKDKKNIASILAVIGIIIVIIGLAIVLIKGMPFRGSGLGTVSIIVGLVLAVIGGYMLYSNPKA